MYYHDIYCENFEEDLIKGLSTVYAYCRRSHLKSVIRLQELFEVCVLHAPIWLLTEGEDLPDSDSIGPASTGNYPADIDLPNIRLCAELPLGQNLVQIWLIFRSR